MLEFVDKERLTVDGRKRTGDLLIKTQFRGEAAGFLIHLEHQAQPDPDLPRRMLEYFMLDWRDFDIPVYPIVVLSHTEPLRRNPAPLCVDFPNAQVLRFTFDVVNLARMEAQSYLKIANPASLALAARMKFDATKRVSLTRDFFSRLAETAVDLEDKLLAAGFFSRYQRLTRREALQLERERSKVVPDMTREKVIQLTNPFIELGMSRGRRRGLKEGREREIELVLRQLKRRLGVVSPSQEKALRMLGLNRIEALGEALLEFSSPTDLDHWLRKHCK